MSLLTMFLLFAFSAVASAFSTAPLLQANPRVRLKATVTAIADEAEYKTLLPMPAQRRILGSQENLMLPRQYSPGKDVFPQMNHVCCAVLSSTPSEKTLRQAIDDAMRAHPLLRCHVEGDGQPDERIDLMQMVRKGEPNPCTFVSSGPNEFTSKDVLSIVDVLADDRQALDASWKVTFQRDIDDGSWCKVHEGPLWKLEWHRHQENAIGKPCSLVFSFNHAISDQSSANRLIDQIVANMASVEADGYIKRPGKTHEMPVSVEDSVLGLHQRWNDVQTKGVSLGTIAYVAGKAAEGFKSPVILPDSEADGTGLWSSLSIIAGRAAGGEDEGSESRKSTLQFRTLSESTTSKLLSKCRENNVSITHALTSTMTLTATDFIDGGRGHAGEKSRNYKVLMSLDLRRFGAQLDQGETVGCLAGSMDLIHGPFPDHSGESLRRNPTTDALQSFWKLAQSGKDQTNAFVASEGPKHAMRVFDFAMTVADLNNLVYLTAQSKDSKGRAYSAGVTNNGVYEKLAAFRRQGEVERSSLQVCG
jgi:hypothetical protein